MTFRKFVARRRWPLAAMGLLALPGLALAHTRLKPGTTLIPRSDQSGLKTDPCGGIDPTTDPAKRTQLTAGDTLTIYWEETIQHPGHFRVAFSKDGVSGFESNIVKDNIVDDKDDPGPDINNPATYHQFSTTITVPGTNCEHCSFQLIQVMTDSNPPRNYHSCADIRIVGGVDAPPDTGSGSASGSEGTGSGATSGSEAGSDNASGSASGSASGTATTTAKPAAPANLKIIVKHPGGTK